MATREVVTTGISRFVRKRARARLGVSVLDLSMRGKSVVTKR